MIMYWLNYKEYLIEKGFMNGNLKIKEIAKKYRKDLANRCTWAEDKFRHLLRSLRIRYNFQKVVYVMNGDFIKTFYIVDFYLPDYNCVIEVDGRYHDNIVQIVKDDIREDKIKEILDCKFIRFNNNDLNDIRYCKNRLCKYLNIKLKKKHKVIKVDKRKKRKW